ncbi:MAG: aspartate kinase [Clostridiales bacterium]|nr:aspartate kinase [Clostridiales bacterium]
MNIIVQKFGGTSVSSSQKRMRVIEKARDAMARGYFPVLVVSAMGRSGEPYATDTLLSLVNKSAGGADPRDTDMLISCGEIISAVVMASELRGQGIDAHAVSGAQAGIYTDDTYGHAECVAMDPRYLRAMIERGVVPVVAGFQGRTAGGDTTTLGRGGSDTTASILGAGLGASLVEIYTDVDGILTADPRIVPDAALLREMSYEEVFQMADNGSRVIHPRAVDIAMQGGVPVVVRGTLSDDPGTHICARVPLHDDTKPNDVVTSIAHIAGRLQVTVEAVAPSREHRLLRNLAAAGVSIDLINIFPDTMVFTVSGDQREPLMRVLEEDGCRYRLRENCCKVSAVGVRMRGVPGVMARIMQALSGSGVTVLQTVDSHMTISCLVSGDEAETAIRSLHREFGLARHMRE